MCLDKKIKKSINNSRDGYHFNSKHWQNYKLTVPSLPPYLFSCAYGMLLGDAGIHWVGRQAYIKFEQGHKQSAFLFHLFDLFSGYVYMQKPGIRFEKNSEQVKSYWFKTFSPSEFTKLHALFYSDKKGAKRILPGVLQKHLDWPIG